MIEYTMFNRLPAGSQIEALVKKGTAVAQRNHLDWNITLYALNNYFVELWVKQKLEIVGTFHETANPLEILEPYINNIDVQPFLDILFNR